MLQFKSDGLFSIAAGEVQEYIWLNLQQEFKLDNRNYFF